MPRKPDYQRIADDIRRQIEDGELAPGAKLPTHAALAQQYGVSLQPVKMALWQLELQGLVEGHQGKGVFVVEPTSSSQ